MTDARARSSSGASVALEDLDFEYAPGTFSLSVGRLSIESGDKVAFIGPSGSGKTTLLGLIAGILVPRSGTVRVDGEAISALDDDARRRFRRRSIGFVFQEFELLEYLTALENILLPLRIAGSPRASARDEEIRARALAERVGLVPRLGHYPAMLSPGEKQRVAVCRALVTDPRLVLADEPTSSLDRANAMRTYDILFDLVGERGATLLVLTHDSAVLDRFDRIVRVPEFEDVR
jgi:putative ABC transport system ATP-binding protein